MALSDVGLSIPKANRAGAACSLIFYNTHWRDSCTLPAIMRPLLQDLRYAIRVSAKSPGFTVVAVATLAVGIAASATVFTWIDSVLLRPIPGAAKASELAVFETLTPNREFLTTSYPDYRDYRDHLKLLAGLALHQARPLTLGDEDHAQRVWGELVSGNYFAVLGVKPALGRTFAPDEQGDTLGAYPVAVISYGLWRRSYNADAGAIGQKIRVNRRELTIVGVAPQEFRGGVPGLQFDLWIPAVMAPQLNVMPDWMLRDRQTRSFFGMARLRPGVRHRAGARRDRGAGTGNGEGRAAHQPRHERHGSSRLEGALRSTEHSPRAAHDSDGGLRPGAADRLRERGQPAAGARLGTAEGILPAPGIRRRAGRGWPGNS